MSEALRAVYWYMNQGWAKYPIAKDVYGPSESVVVGQRHQSRYFAAHVVVWYGCGQSHVHAALRWEASCEVRAFRRGALSQGPYTLLASGGWRPWGWAILLAGVALCTKLARLWMVGHGELAPQLAHGV